MWSLFNIEFMRFRTWAVIAGTAHLAALAFITRIADLGQQSLQVYWAIGGLYALVGALLGLYQVGGYRRDSQWVTLLHRPLHPARISLMLGAAAGCVLLFAVALPALLIAIWQHTTTARVVDLRHWLLPCSAWLIALSGYLTGAFCVLRRWRFAAAPLALLSWMIFAEGTGLAMLPIEAIVAVWLSFLLIMAFKPDVDAPAFGLWRNALLALPLSTGVYMLIVLALFGLEFLWIAQGSHPLNTAVPPKGGHTEVEKMDPRARMLYALRGAALPDADGLTESVRASKPQALAVRLREQPHRNALSNVESIQFSDADRHLRWTFRHDQMRLQGERLLDGRRAGLLGVGPRQQAFPGVALPIGGLPGLPEDDTLLLAGRSLYRYASADKTVSPYAQADEGETVAGVGRIGSQIVLMSDKALYFLAMPVAAGDEASHNLPSRLPLPEPTADLSSIDMTALADGNLICLTFSGLAHTAVGAIPTLYLLRTHHDGRAPDIRRRQLSFDYPAVHRYRTWWPSPALHFVQDQARGWFARPSPLAATSPVQVPLHIKQLAAALMLLSALLAAYRMRHGYAVKWQRVAWIAFCALMSLPGLAAMWLMCPRPDQLKRPEAAAGPFTDRS